MSFILPVDRPTGVVSVVGDFNGWNPDAHILKPRRDGVRAVTLALPSGCSFAFRYVTGDGASYVEQRADRVDGADSFAET